MKTLLVLTNFSPNATNAAEYGYDLAGKLGANIILCNAIDVLEQVPQGSFVAWPMEGEDISQNLSNTELMELKRHLEYRNTSGFNTTVHCLNYSGPVEDIFEISVERYKIDMIVMGTHESGNLRNIFRRNHNNIIITQTTVPLLLVPPTAIKSNKNRIAFATDLKSVDVDFQYIVALVPIAKLLNADILIAHIGVGQDVSPIAAKYKERLLTRISNEVDYPHFYFKFLTASYADSGLESLCESENITILAVIPRKHSFIKKLVSPGVTQKIVNHFSIPLLIFPSQ